MSLNKLAERLGNTLAARILTLCTAESCTGGLLATTITDIPGSSRYFLGGVIAYSDTVKRALLHVPSSYLDTFGAVSAPVAIAMARGAIPLFGADIAIATTGIAGPAGGTAEKPVGLVFVSIVAPNYAACQQFVWPHDRLGNKEATVAAALSMALNVLANIGA